VVHRSQLEERTVAALHRVLPPAWWPRLALAGLVALGASVVALLVRASRLAWIKAYAIDEFYYAHRAWTALHPGKSFRDHLLAEHGFVTDLAYAPAVLLGGGDPARMIYLRPCAMAFFAVGLGALGWLAAHCLTPRPASPARRLGTALLAMLLALLCPRVVWHAVEIRPDGVALCLVLAAVALLCAPRPGPRWRASLGGILLALAGLASIKVLVYGAPIALVWLADLAAWRRGRATALGHPPWLACSFLLVVGVVVLVAALQGVLPLLWHGIAVEPRVHEAYYPAQSAWPPFRTYLHQAWPLWLLAIPGLVSALWPRASATWSDRGQRILLVLLPVSGWLSFFVQRAPYSYSLMPGHAFTVLLAAGGLAALLRALPAGPAGLLCLGAAPLLAWRGGAALEPRFRNQRQIEVQRLIHRLVSEEDRVYDMSATFVYRPRAHELAFVDKARRLRFGAALDRDVPAALVAGEAMLFIHETRFHSNFRDRPLGRFIATHYQRYNDDLRVWGRQWPGGASVSDTFLAPRAARYFVHPPDALQRGTLTIDGRPVTAPIVTLERGHHPVRWQPGANPPARLHLIWLPRDGRPFDPAAPSPPFELGRRVLP
jgi:hypothetical protein